MIKVLFVLPYSGTAEWGMFYSEGVTILSAVLKEKGHQTDLFLLTDLKDVKKLLEHINKTKPHIVAFSFTEVQYEGVKKIAAAIKKAFPKIFIIGGGVHCILNPRQVIKNPNFDAICTAEGEYAITALAEALEKRKKYTDIKSLWIRKDGQIYQNPNDPPVDMNHLPFPDRELFHRQNLDYYQGPVWLQDGKKGGSFFMSRGCIFNCNNCSSPAINKLYGKHYYRQLDPKLGIAQIKQAVKKYHYDYLIFADDTFTLNKKWLVEFLDLYRKEIHLPFNIQTRIGTFNQETVRKLKKAGCYLIIIGLESGNQDIRENILNRKITDEEIIQGARWIKEAGITLATYNMMGLPSETPSKFLQTVRLNAQIQTDYPYIFIFFPYKQTRLYDICQEQNLITKTPRGFVERENTILKLPGFSRKDILFYFENFQRLFNLLKFKGSFKQNLYRRLLFNLYAIPPSSFFFKFSQIILKIIPDY